MVEQDGLGSSRRLLYRWTFVVASTYNESINREILEEAD